MSRHRHIMEFLVYRTKVCTQNYDECNSTMAKAMGLIFSLFDVTSAREVPFGIPSAFFTSALLCVPFIFADSLKCQFGGGTWWLPFWHNGNHSYGYFDYKGTFRTAVDLYCCVTGWTWLKMKLYGFSDNNWDVQLHLMRYVWVLLIIIISKKS